jgi:hypothetical protein
MTGRPRRPARSPDPPTSAASALPPAGLFPWEIPQVTGQAVEPHLRRGRKVVTVELPFVRFPLARDEFVHPLSVIVRTQDLKAWTDALTQDPTILGTLLLEQWLRASRPVSRGRHAGLVGAGKTIRLYATWTFLTLKRLADHDAREVLAALQRHARDHDFAGWRHLERQGRWHLSLLTAYVLEADEMFRQAFGKVRPTEDPQAFYKTYIRGPQLRTLRAILAKRPTMTFPVVDARLARLTQG